MNFLAWHFTKDTLRDGRPIPAVGETLRHEGPLEPCHSGLHASEHILDALKYAPSLYLHRVRCGGHVWMTSDKICCTERTILWSHKVSYELLNAFARKQALSVIHLWDAPDVVRRYLEDGDPALRSGAFAAANAYRPGWRAELIPAACAAYYAAGLAYYSIYYAAYYAAGESGNLAEANALLEQMIREEAGRPTDEEV